jgi:hypothetical protein
MEEARPYEIAANRASAAYVTARRAKTASKDWRR